MSDRDDPESVRAFFEARRAARRQAEEAEDQHEDQLEQPERPATEAQEGEVIDFADLPRSYKVLRDIDPRAWEHPTDRAALRALRSAGGAEEVLKRFVGLVGERSIRYLYLASAVRTSPRQFARVHATWLDCCRVLDIEEPPELYVAQQPFLNAGAVGMDRPFVVLNSATIRELSPDELRFVLGHELGHVMSGHVLYKTMLRLLLAFSLGFLGAPLGRLAITGLLAALREWDRKSELSSDRAGLLCVQSPAAAYRSLMKMAGGVDVDEMSVAEFLAQAEEYRDGGDVLDGVLKLRNLLWQSHPFAVLRLAELKQWVDDGTYGRVLRGDYVRRGEAASTFADDVEDSARTYKERVNTAEDPLLKLLNDLGSALAEAGDRVLKGVRDRWGEPPR
jgi:Zn-dependent protease with chaperone function